MDVVLHQHERTFATAIFQWLLFSGKQLDLSSFLAAIASSTGELRLTVYQVLHYTFQLVVFDKDRERFSFTHLSVREYLEVKPEFSSAIGHAALACVCLQSLKYLDAEAGRKSRVSISSMEILASEYGYFYWPVHCQRAGVHRQRGELGDIFREFLGSRRPSSYALWMDFMTTYGGARWRSSHEDWQEASSFLLCGTYQPVFAACIWGFDDIISQMAQEGTLDRKSKNRNGHTILYTAARFKSTSVVRLLMQDDFEAGETGGFCGSLLAAAISEAHRRVRKTPTGHRKYRAVPPAIDDEMVDTCRRLVYDDEERALLAFLVFLDKADLDNVVFCYAALHHKRDIVLRLLSQDIDIEEIFLEFNLRLAVLDDDKEMITLLLSHGLNVRRTFLTEHSFPYAFNFPRFHWKDFPCRPSMELLYSNINKPLDLEARLSSIPRLDLDYLGIFRRLLRMNYPTYEITAADFKRALRDWEHHKYDEVASSASEKNSRGIYNQVSSLTSRSSKPVVPVPYPQGDIYELE